MAEADSTSEAGRVPQVDDSEMYWHEATSKNGKKYRVGVLKSDYPDLSEQEVKDLLGASKQGPPEGSLDSISGLGDGKRLGSGGKPIMEIVHSTGDNPIYWPYTRNDDSWKKPAQRVRDKFDIKLYSLSMNHLGYYNHKLRIDIAQRWNYDFYDEAGDSYRIYTYRTGVHSVTYDSEQPTIVKIIAWSGAV
jgi:hypothetical protein